MVTVMRIASEGLIINRLYWNNEDADEARANHRQRDEEQWRVPHVPCETQIIEGSGDDTRSQGTEKRGEQ
jgi:hypothetical protein